MADVFISYTHQDRTLAAAISVALEENGITSWFDDSLKAGSQFRNEIVNQIDAARAVVVVWSKAATESLWVKAEASRALDQRKLIPVFGSSELSHKDLPLPFAELHTIAAVDLKSDGLVESAKFVAEIFEDEDLRMSPAQILSLVPKPAIPQIINSELITRVKSAIEAPSGAGRDVSPNPSLSRILSRELLAWPSVLGAAITIVSSVEPLIKISAWAQQLAAGWRSFYVAAWTRVLELASIETTPLSAAALTCTLFFALIALASSEFVLSRIGYIAPALKVRWEDFGRIGDCGPSLARWDTPTPYIIGAIYVVFFSKYFFGWKFDHLQTIDWISLGVLLLSFVATLRMRIYPEVYKARLWRTVGLACLVVVLGALHAYVLESHSHTFRLSPGTISIANDGIRQAPTDFVD